MDNVADVDADAVRGPVGVTFAELLDLRDAVTVTELLRVAAPPGKRVVRAFV
jgi:hypothetical protein